MKMPMDYPERACADEDRETFFPHRAENAEAKAVIREFCQRCPVVMECLEWAMVLEGGMGKSGRSGIFGGLTPRQRARLHDQRARRAA